MFSLMPSFWKNHSVLYKASANAFCCCCSDDDAAADEVAILESCGKKLAVRR